MVSTLFLTFFGESGLGHRKHLHYFRLLTPKLQNLDFSKSSRTWFSTTSEYGFLIKIFFMIYFANRRNLIVWFPLILEIFGKICIAITYYQIPTSEMLKLTLVFLSGCFSSWPTKSGKKLKILRTKWDFNRK